VRSHKAFRLLLFLAIRFFPGFIGARGPGRPQILPDAVDIAVAAQAGNHFLEAFDGAIGMSGKANDELAAETFFITGIQLQETFVIENAKGDVLNSRVPPKVAGSQEYRIGRSRRGIPP
jgi:hypothetical protein